MQGSPLGPSGEDITWPDQVAPRGRRKLITRQVKPQTSNLKPSKQNVHTISATVFQDLANSECTSTTGHQWAHLNE